MNYCQLVSSAICPSALDILSYSLILLSSTCSLCYSSYKVDLLCPTSQTKGYTYLSKIHQKHKGHTFITIPLFFIVFMARCNVRDFSWMLDKSKDLLVRKVHWCSRCWECWCFHAIPCKISAKANQIAHFPFLESAIPQWKGLSVLLASKSTL